MDMNGSNLFPLEMACTLPARLAVDYEYSSSWSGAGAMLIGDSVLPSGTTEIGEMRCNFVSYFPIKMVGVEDNRATIRRKEKMPPLAGMPISRDPMALADLYHAGLDKNWTNQKEAVAAMARFSPKVTREALNRAIAVSKLPNAVLRVFEVAGIWPSTARALVQLSRKYGATVLEDRAKAIDPTGKTWSEIIALLDGREAVPPKRAVGSPSALALAAEYKRGLTEGRWTSIHSAVDACKAWDRRTVRQAVAISNLPPEVLELFVYRPLTFSLGATLLRIQKAMGAEQLARRAAEMLKAPRRRTTDEIVASLLKARLNGGANLTVRLDGTDMVFEFKVPVDEPGELLFTAEEMGPIVEMAVMTLRARKQAGKPKTQNRY